MTNKPSVIKKKGKSAFGRDYVAMAEYRAGAPTPTPTKKGMLKKLERKNKGRSRDGYDPFALSA